MIHTRSAFRDGSRQHETTRDNTKTSISPPRISVNWDDGAAMVSPQQKIHKRTIQDAKKTCRQWAHKNSRYGTQEDGITAVKCFIPQYCTSRQSEKECKGAPHAVQGISQTIRHRYRSLPGHCSVSRYNPQRQQRGGRRRRGSISIGIIFLPKSDLHLLIVLQKRPHATAGYVLFLPLLLALLSWVEFGTVVHASLVHRTQALPRH